LAGDFVAGWKLVFRGPDYAAQVVHASLEAAGIRAELLTDTGNLMPGLSAEESRVFVPEESEGEALNLIHTAFPGDLPSEG
jgi:hypothetical protein